MSIGVEGGSGTKWQQANPPLKLKTAKWYQLVTLLALYIYMYYHRQVLEISLFYRAK